MHPVHEPAVPCVLPLHEHLRHGAIIDVHGHVKHHGHHQNFAVELLSGPHIVLHVNFRFNHEHALVLNSYAHGCWSHEVRLHNPLQHHYGHGTHHNYHLQIETHHSHYDIRVNGEHVARFDHRFPSESVQAVGIKGDTHVEKVAFHGFPFHHQWGNDFDYGHGGYNGYGEDHYRAPDFHHGHGHHSFF